LVAGRDDLIGDYMRAIELELQLLERPREVDTLYFGGGTPTHLSQQQFRQLARTVTAWHPLASGYEWTVEANPADLDEPMIDMLAMLGVTRLSIGGQSFRPEKLQLLERDHDWAAIGAAVRRAKQAGMQVALDLIFATPGETLHVWQFDLEAAIEMQPDHISSYGLTFERGTAFWARRLRGQVREIDEDLQREMYAQAIDRLTASGFEHYEVSNFARPGCRSRHNQVYWSGESYFAVGPGAARYVDGAREINHRSTTTYLRRILSGQSPVAERERLSREARARELLVFGLRRMEGVSRSQFMAQTGIEIDALVERPLHRFVEQGLLIDDGNRIRLSRDGLFVSDSLWPEML
jgi:oxygen-independent coproporphyrinogen-3 oxidase